MLFGDLRSIKSLEKKRATSILNKTIKCDDINSINYPWGYIFNLKEGKIVYRRGHPRHLHLYRNVYNQTLYTYNITKFGFSLEVSRDTPSPSPTSFNVLFTQDEPHSWMDITVKVLTKGEIKKYQEFISLFQSVELMHNNTYSPQMIGSVDNNMIVVQLEKPMTQKEFKIKVNVDTHFDGSLFSSDGSPLYYPRTLKWISECSLSSVYSECIIKLPGRPVNFKITQVLPEKSSLNIFWSQDKFNSDLFFLNKYHYACFLKVLCLNSRFKKKDIQEKE